MLRGLLPPVLPAEDLHRPPVVLPVLHGYTPTMAEQVVIDGSIIWVLVLVLLVLAIIAVVRRI